MIKSTIIKKIFLIIFVIFLTSLSVLTTQAATTSPDPTVSSGEKLIDEINNLREKVASKVAELNLVEKRGIYITVTEVTGNKITGTDLINNTRLVDVDELTEFSSASSKTFGISDIETGSKISIIGLYNKQSKRILARFISTETFPVFINGVITEIDKANFTITVKAEDKTETIVDIENVTRTSTYTSEDGIVRLGFSKLELNNRVHVVGYNDIEEKNRISGTRVLVLSELAINPKIEITQELTEPTSQTSITPTGSVTPVIEN